MSRRPAFLSLAFIAALGVTMLAMSGSAWAVRPNERLSDPKLEARAHRIGEELRCLVCQNESIEDSDAELAHDLRLLVRRLVAEGDSDAQVKQYIVARYGTYVLLKPPFDLETCLLWFGPLVLLLCGVGLAVIFYRRDLVRAAGAPPLSDDEKRRVAELLDNRAAESRDD